ncbi:MAG: hypothetical protein GWN48_17740, partial [Actinobacteria bacterium]|nr:hypothetical protein [Actinomycetota bacterium]
AITVDYDDRDFLEEGPDAVAYVIPDAPIHTKTFFSDVERAVRDHVYRTREVQVLRNRALKLYSRVGETSDDFSA